MFFRKKTTSNEPNVAKQGIKKMDAVVTGVILSGIVASIYGVKKLREKEEHNITDTTHMIPHDTGDQSQKKSLIQKLFRR